MAKLTEQQFKDALSIGFMRVRDHDGLFTARVLTAVGRLDADQLACIAEAAKKFGSGEVAFTSRLTVEVQKIPYEKIQEFRDFIAQAGLETGGTGSKVRPAISCKGTVCRFGLYDTFKVSEEMDKKYHEGWSDVVMPHKFKLAFGGCPNSCMKPTTNDMAFVGAWRPKINAETCMSCRKCTPADICPVDAILRDEDNKAIVDYDKCIDCGRCMKDVCPFDAVEDDKKGVQVYYGGVWGKEHKEARKVGDIIPVEEIDSVIEKGILLYRGQGMLGERSSNTVDRLGIEKVEHELFTDEILERKERILARDLGAGGATC